MQTRANKGGETGMNGYEYAGGQFMPTTEMPPKVRRRLASYMRGRQQVEPRVWELPPTVNSRALFEVYCHLIGVVNGVANVIAKPESLAYYCETAEYMSEICAAYNAGARWMHQDLGDDGFFSGKPRLA
jgi:hypothetical protein